VHKYGFRTVFPNLNFANWDANCKRDVDSRVAAGAMITQTLRSATAVGVVIEKNTAKARTPESAGL
jgi:hypothetical protein